MALLGKMYELFLLFIFVFRFCLTSNSLFLDKVQSFFSKYGTDQLVCGQKQECKINYKLQMLVQLSTMKWSDSLWEQLPLHSMWIQNTFHIDNDLVAENSAFGRERGRQNIVVVSYLSIWIDSKSILWDSSCSILTS